MNRGGLQYLCSMHFPINPSLFYLITIFLLIQYYRPYTERYNTKPRYLRRPLTTRPESPPTSSQPYPPQTFPHTTSSP